tara:strand:+ start:341 stop:478 length:138 start_codon:yes stop_codon:yes gene_type:complete
MDQQQKLRLVEALVASKAKGNQPLAEAVREVLEQDQASNVSTKAA